MGASHSRRGLSSAAAAGRLIERSGKGHSERQGEGGDGPSVGPTTEANPLRGDAHQARNPNGSLGRRTIHQGQRPLAARTGRTQTRNRHDSPKPKTLLTRGGRPHNSPPAKSHANHRFLSDGAYHCGGSNAAACARIVWRRVSCRALPIRCQTGKTQQEIAAACREAGPNHFGPAIARHKRAGRIVCSAAPLSDHQPMLEHEPRLTKTLHPKSS